MIRRRSSVHSWQPLGSDLEGIVNMSFACTRNMLQSQKAAIHAREHHGEEGLHLEN